MSNDPDAPVPTTRVYLDKPTLDQGYTEVLDAHRLVIRQARERHYGDHLLRSWTAGALKGLLEAAAMVAARFGFTREAFTKLAGEAYERNHREAVL